MNYLNRCLEEKLASEVATRLMEHDAIGTHARDELDMSETLTARPIQAAFASAGAFLDGAVLPLLMVLMFLAMALTAGVGAVFFGIVA